MKENRKKRICGRIVCMTLLLMAGCSGKEPEPEHQLQGEKQKEGWTEQQGEAVSADGIEESKDNEEENGTVETYDNGVFRYRYDRERWMKPEVFAEGDDCFAYYIYEKKEGAEGDSYLVIRIEKNAVRPLGELFREAVEAEEAGGYTVSELEEKEDEKYEYILSDTIHRGMQLWETQELAVYTEYWADAACCESAEQVLDSLEVYGRLELLNTSDVIESAEMEGHENKLYY